MGFLIAANLPFKARLPVDAGAFNGHPAVPARGMFGNRRFTALAPNLEPADALRGAGELVAPRPMFGQRKFTAISPNLTPLANPAERVRIFPVVIPREMAFGRLLGGRQLPVQYGAGAIVPTVYTISGVTKDSYGNALGSCVVDLFETSTDRLVQSVLSDPATGVYRFSSQGIGNETSVSRYYIVAYKAGSPDVAGTTVNTLVGV